MIRITQRKLNFLLFLLCANMILSGVIIFKGIMTERMLKARAIIQTTNVLANWERLNFDEREKIKSLWHPAEYDKVITLEEFLSNKEVQK